jgi:hypothetical protein
VPPFENFSPAPKDIAPGGSKNQVMVAKVPDSGSPTSKLLCHPETWRRCPTVTNGAIAKAGVRVELTRVSDRIRHPNVDAVKGHAFRAGPDVECPKDRSVAGLKFRHRIGGSVCTACSCAVQPRLPLARGP